MSESGCATIIFVVDHGNFLHLSHFSNLLLCLFQEVLLGGGYRTAIFIQFIRAHMIICKKHHRTAAWKILILSHFSCDCGVMSHLLWPVTLLLLWIVLSHCRRCQFRNLADLTIRGIRCLIDRATETLNLRFLISGCPGANYLWRIFTDKMAVIVA